MRSLREVTCDVCSCPIGYSFDYVSVELCCENCVQEFLEEHSDEEER